MGVMKACAEPGCGAWVPKGTARCSDCAAGARARTKRRNAASPYRTPEWQRLRRLVLQRDLHCQAPGCTSTHRLTAHHMRARDAGGADALWNLVALCHGCHNAVEGARRAGTETVTTRYLDLLAQQLHP